MGGGVRPSCVDVEDSAGCSASAVIAVPAPILRSDADFRQTRAGRVFLAGTWSADQRSNGVAMFPKQERLGPGRI